MSTETIDGRDCITLIYQKGPAKYGHIRQFPEIEGRVCTGFSVGHLMDELEDARRLLAQIHHYEANSDADVESYFETLGINPRRYLK